MLEHLLGSGILLLSTLLLRSFLFLLVLVIAGHERWRSRGINIRYAHLFKGKGFFVHSFFKQSRAEPRTYVYGK